MKSIKLIFLIQLNLFFTLNIFSNSYQLLELNSDRIAQAYEEIKKDFEKNNKMRVYAQAGQWATIALVVFVLYKICTNQYDQDQKRLIEVFREVEQKKKENALVLAGAAAPLGNNIGNDIRKSLLRRMFNSTKRFGIACGNFAFPVTVGWASQEVFGSLAQKFSEICAERTISWFVQKRTFIDQIIKNMEQIAFKVAPEPKLVNALPSSTDIENLSACSNKELQELWQLKIQVALMEENSNMDEKSIKIYKEQLALFYNRLVSDIERVIAFIEYRFPDDTYAQHVLAKEMKELGNLFSSKLSQDSLQGILGAVLKFSLQFNHVVSHLLFAQKQLDQATSGGF